MKIAHKLYLVTVVSLITIAGLSYVSYLGVKKIDVSFNDLVQFPIPSILRLSNMTEVFILSVEEAHSYRLYGQTESKQEYYENAREFDRLMTELKKELHYGTPDILNEDTNFIDSISSQVKTLNEIVVADFEQFEHATTTRMSAPETDPFQAQKDSVVSLLHQYREMEKDEVENARTEVNDLTYQTIEMILIAFILLSLILLITNSLLARSITKPLRTLEEAAKRLGQGDFDNKIEIAGKDELSLLASTFNTMSDNVRQSHSSLESEVRERTAELEKTKEDLEQTVAERTAELEKAKTGLEQTVAERTAELQKKFEQVEEMNTMMTGRELKMIELKKEIADLKNKLNVT